jgi:hypothetical protein
MNIAPKIHSPVAPSTLASGPRAQVPVRPMIRAIDSFEAAKTNVTGILIGLSLPGAVAVIAPMYTPTKTANDAQDTKSPKDNQGIKSPR